MAIRAFTSGSDVYSIGGKFPQSDEYVVGKIDFLPETESRSREAYQVDEEQEEPVKVKGTATSVLLVDNSEETVTRVSAQYVVLRMPGDLFDFWVKARKFVLVDGNSDLDEVLYSRLAKLLEKYDRDGLLIRHVFCEKRQVPYHEDVQPVRQVMASLLSELGDEYGELVAAKKASSNGQAAQAQA